MTRIWITEDGIFCRTPLKGYNFSWSELNTIGIYWSRRRSREEIDFDQAIDLQKQGYAGSIRIWISRDENYYSSGGPLFSNGRSMDLDFDEEAWKAISRFRRN